MHTSDSHGGYTRDDTSATSHTHGGLIASNRVEGTNVYDPQGNSLGSISSVMIGKTDGKVAYAVLSFGGFLGIGSEYFPVPWSELRYSTEHDGYVTSLTEADLKGAPQYGADAEADWTDETWLGSVDRHYGTGSRMGGDDLSAGPRGYR
jgi:sporulation protein YlmC with PRC-barrel domain